ncbi:hypothetical protein CDD81_1685 [Ophiocordyceps australis]|uniref:Cell wall proline rich protein n=1 Tax=Ophiocordyceps australis TaxID=1399860 RepID=A0A2C5XVC5_9HYPO|nr:hypothetical protein CDD81_1685 [Ophiocordyceps australis]
MSAIESLATSSDFSLDQDERSRRARALPDFHFNPGASSLSDSDPSTLLHPAASPTTEYPRSIASPSRLVRHGHRRGGSEFVGGSIRDGNSIAVMSTSPTRSESGCASPGLVPPRRGHRRGVSGTISTNDLPTLFPLPSFNIARGSSAPNSPTAFSLQNTLIPMPTCDQAATLPDPIQTLDTSQPPSVCASVPSSPSAFPPAPQVEGGSPRQTRPGRARVGFSDKLEYIPRPLSLVSNDTSSTATARPGHSVSGSISSIMSTNSPGGRDSPASLNRNVIRDISDSRPSTAGAVLDRAAGPQAGTESGAFPKRRNSIPTLLVLEPYVTDVSRPAMTATKASRRWTFFGLESNIRTSATTTKERPPSSSSSESASRETSGASSSDAEMDSTGMAPDSSATDQKGAKKLSKKKKVKGWAGSILPRKAVKRRKRNKVGPVRPPTPPASVSQLGDEEDEAVDHSEATTIPVVSITAAPPTCAHDSTGQRPRSGDDSCYPMIDLDVVLGPFDTPLPRNLEWEAAQRAAGDSSGKRRLHSAQGFKGFSSADMHYHRRTESAPDLPRFESGRSGIHRFSSTSTMADVFEEEEEEEETVADGKRQVNGTAMVISSENKTADDSQDTIKAATVVVKEGSWLPVTLAGEATFRARRRRDVDLGERTKSGAQSVRTECSRTSLHDVTAEETPSIIYRSANVFGVGGSDSAASSPSRVPGVRELPSMETHSSNVTAVPSSPYQTSLVSSSHPSPRLPMSMETQRMSMTPSLVPDENSLQSLLMMGEPGPEMRISEDYDKRSTVSSTSTMTRDCTFGRSQRLSQASFGEQRPMSMSSVASGGRRRASLANFSSRFISSAHGERSKLSMEMTLDAESDNKKSRGMGSKTKQTFGRMMSFLKSSKDGTAS